MVKAVSARTVVSCVFGCLFYLLFVPLALAAPDDFLELPLPYKLPAAQELIVSKAFKNNLKSNLIFYRISAFDWCSLPGYVLTINFHNMSDVPDAVKIGQTNSKEDPYFVALEMHRIHNRPAYVIDSCELWSVLKDCSTPLSIMVAGGDLEVQLAASVRRASELLEEEKALPGDKRISVQRLPIGLDITVGRRTSCTYPKGGRFYWINVPSGERDDRPHCSSRSRNPGLTRAVYFHDPTRVLIDYRNKEYVACQTSNVTEVSSRGAPIVPTASLGPKKNEMNPVISKHPVAEQIGISNPYKIQDNFKEIAYETNSFEWCRLPGYVMTIRFHTISQVPTSVLVAQKPSATHVNLVTVPMRRRVGFPAFVIDSCELWSVLHDCFTPLSIMVAEGDLGMTASLSIRHVSKASEEEQKASPGSRTFSIPRLPVGLHVTVDKRASCSYPRGGSFYWINAPSDEKTVPHCTKNVPNPGYSKAVYFHNPTLTPIDYRPEEYVTCESKEMLYMDTEGGGIRRKLEVENGPEKRSSKKVKISMRGFYRNENDHERLFFHASGFNWCSLPGYRLTLLLDYPELKKGVKPKSVSISLKAFPQAAWVEMVVFMRAGPGINRFTLESCELWSIMTYLSSCPTDVNVTITGLESVNVAATLTAEYVSEVRKVEKGTYNEKGNMYPVQDASIGVALTVTEEEVCSYPAMGNFYWITSRGNKGLPPQCIQSRTNPGLTRAVYFHDTTLIPFDTRPDEFVWCKKTVVEEPVSPVVVQHVYPLVQTLTIAKGYWDTRNDSNSVVYDVSGFNWCSLPGYAIFFMFHSKVDTANMTVSFSLASSSEPHSVAGVPLTPGSASVTYYTVKSCDLWSLMQDTNFCPQKISIRVTGLKTVELRASLIIQHVVVATSSESFTEMSPQKFPLGVEVMCSKPDSCTFPDSSRMYRIILPSHQNIAPRCTQELEGAGQFRAVYFQDFARTEMTHFEKLVNIEVMQNDGTGVGADPKSATLSPDSGYVSTMFRRIPGGPRHSLPTQPVAMSTTANGESAKTVSRTIGGPRHSLPTVSSYVTPEVVLRSGITAARVSMWGETVTYVFLLPFLDDKEFIRGGLGPYVLSFYLRGFLQPPTSVKYSAGGSSQVTLMQGLVVSTSAIGYRVTSCAIWETLQGAKRAPSHTLYVTAARQSEAWAPRLSVTQTLSTPVEDFDIPVGWVASGASGSLLIKEDSKCEFELSENEYNKSVFQFKKPLSPTDFASCTLLSSITDKSVVEHQDNWGDRVYFPNVGPRRVKKQPYDFPTVITVLRCRSAAYAESVDLRGYGMKGSVIILTSLLLLAQAYVF